MFKLTQGAGWVTVTRAERVRVVRIGVDRQWTHLFQVDMRSNSRATANSWSTVQSNAASKRKLCIEDPAT